jgi:hypothetical protein
MTETMEWFQNNWIDLARLGVQCAILAVVVRYGRKLLAALRASQEQVGALLRLSVSDSVAERGVTTTEPEDFFDRSAAAVPVAPEHVEEPEPVFAGAYSRGGYGSEREQSLGGRLAGSQVSGFAASVPETKSSFSSAGTPQIATPSLTPWVSAPASEPERVSAPAVTVSTPRSLSAWLQTPVRQSGAGPLRKVVRWLRAPAGS